MGIFGRILGGNPFGRGKSPQPPQKPPAASRQAEIPPLPIAKIIEDDEEDLTPTFDVEPPEEEPYEIASPENDFLGGKTYDSFTSSNVRWMRYENELEHLYIGYKDGSTYGYGPVSPDQALRGFHAPSKGTWVWDELRIRGTVFGFKVPYWFMDGPSGKIRRWHEHSELSREIHGKIGKEGEPFPGYHPADEADRILAMRAAAKGGLGKKRGKRK
jgi:hypothetical protein